MDLSAVILAGGESRRMGRDKAWLEADGQSLLAGAVAKARELGAEEIFISGREGEDYSALHCPVLLDLEPGFGPLGGIERGLRAAASPLLLVLAVDLPHMTTVFLRQLAARCDVLTGAVPKLNGELEPLAAIYPKRCHVIASDFITQSRHAARDFAEACLREKAVRTFPVASTDAPCFDNWNTPADVPARSGSSMNLVVTSRGGAATMPTV
ncbi:MAG: molybdenum cofactor guanylyltransferase [Verrucomicrobia bacterium]|nr:molybdenum cofactor guanylyltransferase [Verrucomicrobiota bacterium]